MNKRIGLFGGTFDPVHKGHLSIARAFLESSIINELWILLSPLPPHKQDDSQVSYELRLEMLTEAFSGFKDVRISTVEETLPRPSYTYKTVQFIKERNPELQFIFCMGEDSLVQFHNWKHHHEILKEVNLLVAKRPGNTHLEVKDYILYKTHFVLHEPIEISSSQIKNSINDPFRLKEMLSDDVLKIIQREQLYK